MFSFMNDIESGSIPLKITLPTEVKNGFFPSLRASISIFSFKFIAPTSYEYIASSIELNF